MCPIASSWSSSLVCETPRERSTSGSFGSASLARVIAAMARRSSSFSACTVPSRRQPSHRSGSARTAASSAKAASDNTPRRNRSFRPPTHPLGPNTGWDRRNRTANAPPRGRRPSPPRSDPTRSRAPNRRRRGASPRTRAPIGRERPRTRPPTCARRRSDRRTRRRMRMRNFGESHPPISPTQRRRTRRTRLVRAPRPRTRPPTRRPSRGVRRSVLARQPP